MDSLNRDIFAYLVENHLGILDVSHLAQTAKQFYTKPTETLIVKEGIEFCVKTGKIEYLDRFPQKQITKNLLKIAIISRQFSAAEWIKDHVHEWLREEDLMYLAFKGFLDRELIQAIKGKNDKYVNCLLKYDHNGDQIYQNERLYYARRVVKHSNFTCVQNICTLYNIIPDDTVGLSGVALLYGRFDVIDWLSTQPNIYKENVIHKYYWIYGHKCVFKITRLFGIKNSRKTLDRFTLTLLLLEILICLICIIYRCLA